MDPFDPVPSGITHVFTFHILCIFIVGPLCFNPIWPLSLSYSYNPNNNNNNNNNN